MPPLKGPEDRDAVLGRRGPVHGPRLDAGPLERCGQRVRLADGCSERERGAGRAFLLPGRDDQVERVAGGEDLAGFLLLVVAGHDAESGK